MLAATSARAQEPADAPPATAAPPAPAPTPAAPGVEQVQPPKDPERKVSVEPLPAEPRPEGRVTLEVDPVADGAVIAVSLGFAGLLDLINSTGEIRPQQIAASFDRSKLIGIDRGAISQTPDPNAGGYSNIGLGVAVAFAFVDPVISGFREKSVQTGLVDGIMYAESMSLTFAMTNMVKMAVRRPRPQAYIDAEAHKGDPSYSNADTDSSLSFFSGHAAITAAVGATATYLAFARSPHSVRPWITLILAAGLSTAVSIERVRAGKHFPTDVIAGSVAGAGIGVVVPHLHRTEDIKQRRVWVGYAPVDRAEDGTKASGGILQVSGLF
jgi:undecaprenyl-diphosphatase